MSKDEIRKHGAVTEYRPDRDDISGGRDKSVQAEALDAEGIDNLAATSGSSGGGAGRIDDDVRKPDRAGGERDDVELDLTR
jgi:hypothetical protein